MRHLRCLCFVRPSPESIQSLIEELRDPKYGEYNICGSCRTFGERQEF
jgi:vacuolar protein sorting-associated protein 45